MTDDRLVLLMRDLILFPSSEIRLELEDKEDKKLIKMASNFYDDEIVLINLKDNLEVSPDINNLPTYGVLGKIKMKIEMPNGKMRVVIYGLRRIIVSNYTRENNLILASISDNIIENNDNKTKDIYFNLLMKKMKSYVTKVPYISNSIINDLSSISDPSVLADAITLILPLEYERKLLYLEEPLTKNRVKMLIDDISKDLKIIEIEEELDTKVSDKLEEEQRKYILKEKLKIIKTELGDEEVSEVDLLRKKVKKLKAPEVIKDRLYLEIDRYENLSMMSPELSLTKNYIDTLLSLPWENRCKDEEDLIKVKERLDKTHYALDKVKDRVIEYLAVKNKTKGLTSPILCLIGPPGVGKTTLAKSIGKALKRNTTKISLGGVSDEAEIVGHRKTYVGSLPGLIIQGMKKAGVKNPVFIIDEIDKMTKDFRGDPASALLEVLDKEQNSHFVDHYIEEEFDLSEVMFITTANDEREIPAALKDRLEMVHISSYTEYEKLDITKSHLLPKLLKEHGLKKKDVVFSDDIILYIIRFYTKEAGVRELERLISRILRKIVKEMLISNKNNTYKLNKEMINNYLGEEKYSYNEMGLSEVGVVNGLAYTSFGGDILPIEASKSKGEGKLILTGSLGDVLKESAMIASSYIKANAKYFDIEKEINKKEDIHINLLDAATPKEGPSAGAALTLSLLSLYKNKKISSDIAITGEISLRGKILEIGGLKEKLIGAGRAGIKTVYIPAKNKKDLVEVPAEIKKSLKVIPVKDFKEIYEDLFKD